MRPVFPRAGWRRNSAILASVAVSMCVWLLHSMVVVGDARRRSAHIGLATIEPVPFKLKKLINPLLGATWSDVSWRPAPTLHECLPPLTLLHGTGPRWSERDHLANTDPRHGVRGPCGRPVL